MSEFVILHLSDAHIGNPAHSANARQVLSPFLNDLQTMKQQHKLRPHLIVFSGDLAWGQIPKSKLKDQYARAAEFLSSIRTQLDVTDTQAVPLLLVPGNHDCNFNEHAADQDNWFNTATAEDVDRMLIEAGRQWKRICDRLKQWRTFAKSILPYTWNLDRLLTTTGTIDFEGQQIGLVGFNAAWAAHRGSQKAQLRFGRHQLDCAMQHLENCAFRIAVSHYPTSWLHEYDSSLAIQRLQSQYAVFLHGHEHQEWFVDSDGHLQVTAGSLYQGSSKPNAYAWIAIDFANQRCRIALREYSDLGSGGWRAMQIPGRNGFDGTWYPVKHLFQRQHVTVSHGNSTSPPSPPSLPGCRTRLGAPGRLDPMTYVQTLESAFRLDWEPNSYKPQSPTIVYWPIRVRYPTPIHAVQAFVAAGFSKLGCQIVVGLDDLGTIECSVEALVARLYQWFGVVGATSESAQQLRFSQVTNTAAITAWPTIEAWLGRSDYRLDRVLAVSKLLDSPDTTLAMATLAAKRPRRLLSPPLVWTALQTVIDEHQDSSFITLGGFDERDLWHAWRECIPCERGSVGHLYIPQLLRKDGQQPIRMGAAGDLRWESRQDIKAAVERELASEEWRLEGQLLPWAIDGCVGLPLFIRSPSDAFPISDEEALSRVDVSTFAEDISPRLAEFLLPTNTEGSK